MSKILEFYRGEGANQEGLFLKDIMKFNDEQLEENHYYIQWLFPLKEPSLAVPGSPILTDEDITFFEAHWDTPEERQEMIDLRLAVLDAFHKMIGFYGLRLIAVKRDGDEFKSILLIKDENSFEGKSKNWLTPKNHYYLRLTRILSSLLLLSDKCSANMLYDCLCDIYEEHKGVIGPLTKQFWDEAMER